MAMFATLSQTTLETIKHISGYATINLWYVTPLKRIYNLQWNV